MTRTVEEMRRLEARRETPEERRQERLEFDAAMAAGRFVASGSPSRPVLTDNHGVGLGNRIEINNQGEGTLEVTAIVIANGSGAADDVVYSFTGQNPEREMADMRYILDNHPDIALAMDAMNMSRYDPTRLPSEERGEVPDVRDGQININR